MNNINNDFNALRHRIIFTLWTGDEALSMNRIQSLWSIVTNTGCPVVFINKSNIADWVLDDYPLHEGYSYLSSTHKADYLRCYLMHHYGGGYTDIKLTHKNWHPFFDDFIFSNNYALGYKELPQGIPHLKNEIGDKLRANYFDLIGLCAFIFRKQTRITQDWYQQVHNKLDEKLEFLKINPAKHPQDQFGAALPDGTCSNYPLCWAEILGEILHPLMYLYKDRLMQRDINPIFHSYR